MSDNNCQKSTEVVIMGPCGEGRSTIRAALDKLIRGQEIPSIEIKESNIKDIQNIGKYIDVSI